MVETGKSLRDTKQAAKRVNLSKSKLDKLRVYGGGPRYTKLGRSVRYTDEDLDEWVARNRRSSTSTALAAGAV